MIVDLKMGGDRAEEFDIVIEGDMTSYGEDEVQVNLGLLWPVSQDMS